MMIHGVLTRSCCPCLALAPREVGGRERRRNKVGSFIKGNHSEPPTERERATETGYEEIDLSGTQAVPGRIGGKDSFFGQIFRTGWSDSGQRTMRRVAKKIGWRKPLLLVLGIGAVVLFFSQVVDLRSVRDWMQSLDHRLLLVLTAVLPLFGFSISLVYLVIGGVFGGPVGVAVVAGITAIHLVGSHWIGQGYLRERLLRWLEKRKKHLPELPEGQNVSVALMLVLVPGLPYFVRNYLLAVSGIPLRIYFWVCWPIYVIRSCVVLFLGDFSTDLNAKNIMILGGIFALKLGICASIFHRVRARMKSTQKGTTVRTPLQKRLARIGRLD